MSDFCAVGVFFLTGYSDEEKEMSFPTGSVWFFKIFFFFCGEIRSDSVRFLFTLKEF